MLDAAGCTCPTGFLWRGVYDTTGVQYKVPEWVVVEPDGLAEEEEGEAATGPTLVDAHVHAAPQLDGDDKDDVKLVRIRTSHNQRDVMISIRRKEFIVEIIEMLKKQAGVRRRYMLLNPRSLSLRRTCGCDNLSSYCKNVANNRSLIISPEFDLLMADVCIKTGKPSNRTRTGTTPTTMSLLRYFFRNSSARILHISPAFDLREYYFLEILAHFLTGHPPPCSVTS